VINRIKATEVQSLLCEFPAVALLGARQVGKTTLAKTLLPVNDRSFHFLDLERGSDLVRLSDAESYLSRFINDCVVIDEVQQEPRLFTILRPLIDADRKPGRFLLLGSSSLRLIKGASESLAGRIAFVYLAPINLLESQTGGIMQHSHWFRGGYPDSLLAPSDQASQNWLDNYLTALIERDLETLFEINFPRNALRNLCLMLAGAQGGIWSATAFSSALGTSAPTVSKYVSYLEAAFFLFQLPAWYVNVKKRVIKAPKIYVWDSGIVHRLNRILSFEDLQGNLIVGSSWEGYVISQIMSLKGNHIDLYYYRTQHGAECDLILVKGIRPISCVEIKYSNTPNLNQGYYHCIEDLGTSSNFVITPQSDDFFIRPFVRVCSLFTFLEKYLFTI